MTDQKKILLIEDDAFTSDVYNDILTQAGYDVSVAIDGEEGLFKARQGGYALILLDLLMPKVDGLGFLQGLKEKPAVSRNGKIVVLTNITQDPVIQEALKLGANSFMIKSDLTPGQLVEKVKQILG